MRIAQLSLEGYFNYGNILQKFALHHTLKKFADFVEFLYLTDKTLFSETGLNLTVQCVINKERRNWEQKFWRFGRECLLSHLKSNSRVAMIFYCLNGRERLNFYPKH